MNNKQIALIQGLLRKTEVDEAHWNTTEVSDQYKLLLQSGSILVDKYAEEDEYELAVFNSKGTQIDTLRLGRYDAGYEELFQLFNIIFRKLHNVDETLDSMLGEIKSKRPIG
jgi:hypothetical protein